MSPTRKIAPSGIFLAYLERFFWPEEIPMEVAMPATRNSSRDLSGYPSTSSVQEAAMMLLVYGTATYTSQAQGEKPSLDEEPKCPDVRPIGVAMRPRSTFYPCVDYLAFGATGFRSAVLFAPGKKTGLPEGGRYEGSPRSPRGAIIVFIT